MAASSSTAFRSIRASELQPRAVEWLWEPRVPVGGLTILAGPPGLGKSLLSIRIAADVTSGRFCASSGDVLMLTAEDSLEHVVVPRLVAANAALERVHFAALDDPAHRQLMLPGDTHALSELAGREGVRLIIVDPLMAHLSGKVNSWQDQDVRLALAPLAHLADNGSLAILIVAHLNKSQRTDPVQRLGGSIGIAAAARSVLLLAADPGEDQATRRVLAHVKSNLHQPAASLAYRVSEVVIDDGEAGGIATARIEEIGESPYTGSDLLIEPPETEAAPAVSEAAEFLAAELADGPVTFARLTERGQENGFSADALKRAKKKLGVRSTKLDFLGGWAWVLPRGSGGE